MSASHQQGVTPAELSEALDLARNTGHSMQRRRILELPGGFAVCIVGTLTRDALSHLFAIIDSATAAQTLLEYDLPLDLAEHDYGRTIKVIGRTPTPSVPDRLRITAYHSSTTTFSDEERALGIRFIDPQVVQFVESMLTGRAEQLPGRFLTSRAGTPPTVKL